MEMTIIDTRFSRIAEAALAILILSAVAQAQSVSNTASQADVYGRHYFQGYLFAAPGTYVGFSESTATMHVGGGGEALLYKGLGLGAEMGVLWALRGSEPLGLFSVDGSYHFSRQRKFSPFLVGGYSVTSGEGTRNLVNYGGGVHYWFREKMGIRLEFRDHLYTDGTERHILSFRIAFALR